MLDNAWYVNFGNGSTTGYYAVAQYAASHAYSVGAIVRQLTAPAVGNERCFVCVAAGTSGAEPSWTVTRGAKNTSGATFQECTGAAALNGDATNQPNWAAVHANSTSATLGQVCKDAAGTHIFIVTTAGTLGSSEPSWNTTSVGNTTTDNTTTWTYIGLASSFSAWGAPHARLTNAYTATWGAAGNSFYVGDNHAETSSASISPTSPGTAAKPCVTLSIDHTLSLPPASASPKVGATITNSTSGGITLKGSGSDYFDGIAFSTNVTGNAMIIDSTTAVYTKFANCKFQLTGGGGTIVFGGNIGGAGASIDLVNTTFDFANSAATINWSSGVITWRNTANAVTGAAVPLDLMKLNSSNPSDVLIEGVDLSAINTTLVNVGGAGYICFKDCSLNASATVASLSGSATSIATIVDVVNSDSSGTNYRSERHAYGGDMTVAMTVARTNGFSIEGTPLSRKIVSSSGAVWQAPLLGFPINVRNGTINKNVSITLYGIVNAAAVPNNDEFWFDVEYMGSASSPLGSFASGTKTNILATGSALTADTSAWDSQATARANNHAYSLGDVIKVADNPGRIFFCTTAGTSNTAGAGGEPAGYASAVDGGSVTDGGAVFRAGCRFSLTITLSAPKPQLAGLLTIYPKMAKASATLYYDPLPIAA